MKLFLAYFMIVALAEISKRVNPELGGTLAGLPLGAGLSIYFITFEQGMDFTLRGIPWGIAGLAASIIFCFTYFLSLNLVPNNKGLSILLSSMAGTVMFMAAGYLLSSIQLNMGLATVIFFVVFFTNLFLVKRLIGNNEVGKKSPTTLVQLIVRGGIVGILLLVITDAASTVGSRWAVILSSFPMTLYPLLLIIHFEAGRESVRQVILGFSYSVSTLVVFYYSFVYLVPIFGLNLGYLLIYAICIIYIIAYKKLLKSIKNRTPKPAISKA